MNIEPKDKQAIIFDMDGVIFDSERAVYEGWLELSHKYGFQNLDIPYMKCIGVNARLQGRFFLIIMEWIFHMMHTVRNSRRTITQSMTMAGFRLSRE